MEVDGKYWLAGSGSVSMEAISVGIERLLCLSVVHMQAMQSAHMRSDSCNSNDALKSIAIILIHGTLSRVKIEHDAIDLTQVQH